MSVASYLSALVRFVRILNWTFGMGWSAGASSFGFDRYCWCVNRFWDYRVSCGFEWVPFSIIIFVGCSFLFCFVVFFRLLLSFSFFTAQTHGSVQRDLTTIHSSCFDGLFGVLFTRLSVFPSQHFLRRKMKCVHSTSGVVTAQQFDTALRSAQSPCRTLMFLRNFANGTEERTTPLEDWTTTFLLRPWSTGGEMRWAGAVLEVRIRTIRRWWG